MEKYILGIESSCDDTGIALIKVDNEPCENRLDKIIANTILKQEHPKGVIPEYAARAHHEALFDYADSIIANYKIDLVVYTNGPGLIGSLFVGASFAKSLAYGLGVPSYGVNHLHGHILIPYWLYPNQLAVPYLCLLVSGGHTLLVLVEKINNKFKYIILSTTLDDAVGEMLDKVGRHIGLEYPAGPYIEKMAKQFDPLFKTEAYTLPFAMRNRDDFSFSGIKTAAIEQIDNQANEQKKAEFCYTLQEHVAFLLSEKISKIQQQLNEKFGKDYIKHWVISGGVAANMVIRGKIEEAAKNMNIATCFPPINLCTDNGVMIACVAALEEAGEIQSHNLDEQLRRKPDAQMKLTID